MSIRKLTYVACDCCGDPCGDDSAMRDTAAEARANARRNYGWTRTNGIDLCPRCQASSCPRCQKPAEVSDAR